MNKPCIDDQRKVRIPNLATVLRSLVACLSPITMAITAAKHRPKLTDRGNKSPTARAARPTPSSRSSRTLRMTGFEGVVGVSRMSGAGFGSWFGIPNLAASLRSFRLS